MRAPCPTWMIKMMTTVKSVAPRPPELKTVIIQANKKPIDKMYVYIFVINVHSWPTLLCHPCRLVHLFKSQVHLLFPHGYQVLVLFLFMCNMYTVTCSSAHVHTDIVLIQSTPPPVLDPVIEVAIHLSKQEAKDKEDSGEPQ